MSANKIVFDAETVTAEVDLQTLIENFSAAEVLEFIDRGDFLEAIGEDFARAYFGIETE